MLHGLAPADDCTLAAPRLLVGGRKVPQRKRPRGGALLRTKRSSRLSSPPNALKLCDALPIRPQSTRGTWPDRGIGRASPGKASPGRASTWQSLYLTEPHLADSAWRTGLGRCSAWQAVYLADPVGGRACSSYSPYLADPVVDGPLLCRASSSQSLWLTEPFVGRLSS